MASPHLTPTSEQDYLDQDPPIRGQKYVCMSFISPEEVIEKKDAYFFSQYISSFSKEIQELWGSMLEVHKENAELTDGLRSIRNRYEHLFNIDVINYEYDNFLKTDGERLETEYLEKNDFQTTIRGLKVRGSYETLREAQIRAQVLKRLDDKFNVFIAEVGCWCPWSPNPEEIQDQEYAETQLNTLMKSYHENQHAKDQFYAQRKDRMTKEQRETVEASKTAEAVVEKDSAAAEVLGRIDEEDPWQQRKRDTEVSAEATTEVSTEATTEVSAEATTKPKTETELDQVIDDLVQRVEKIAEDVDALPDINN